MSITSQASQRLTVGVMGGMGPEATAHFFSELVRRTEAAADQDHIRVLIDNNPSIPNRHKAIRGETPSVGPELADMAKGLEKAGADFIVMVCNTAHAFRKDIEAALTIPFVSLIDETVTAIACDYPDARKIGIMAADGCLEARLYQDALVAKGLEPLVWDDADLARFMTVVFEVKAGLTGPNQQEGMIALARALEAQGADLLISGCTEIPLVLDETKVSLPVLSSSDLLVGNTILYATGQRALPTGP